MMDESFLKVSLGVHENWTSVNMWHVSGPFASARLEVEEWQVVSHHMAHAALAFYSSPFRSALVVSYDGGGDDGTFNAYRVTGLQLRAERQTCRMLEGT